MKFKHAFLLNELGLRPNDYEVISTSYDHVKYKRKKDKKEFYIRY